MDIYIAINRGDWLDRHFRRPDITNTDWWHRPGSLFGNASAGDLFFVKRTGGNEIFAWARVKHVSKQEAAETAWQYSSEACSADLSYQTRAAEVLKIPVKQVTKDSTITLIALENLTWFPPERRPSVPEGFSKYTVEGRRYTHSDPEFEYLLDLAAKRLEAADENNAARDGYIRITQAQWAEILPLHRELAVRFEKWLGSRGFRDVRREQERVDVRFSRDKHTFLAELKICYDLNTRQAIREALGQVLEYSHYSGRTAAEQWWIILDQEPTAEDAGYIERLRHQYLMPVQLGYETGPTTGEFKVL